MNGDENGENQGLPARSPETPARLRPFFFRMKLEPIKALETMARTRPVRLSEKGAAI